MELLEHLNIALYMVIEDGDETNAIRLDTARRITNMLSIHQCNDEHIHLVYLPKPQQIIVMRARNRHYLSGDLERILICGDIGIGRMVSIQDDMTEFEVLAMKQRSMGTTTMPYEMLMMPMIYCPSNIDLDTINPSPLVPRKQLAAYSHKPKGVKRCYKTQKR